MRTNSRVVLALILMLTVMSVPPLAAKEYQTAKNAPPTSHVCLRIKHSTRNGLYPPASKKIPIIFRQLRGAVIDGDMDALKGAFDTMIMQSKAWDAMYKKNQLLMALGDAAATGNIKAIDFLVAHGVDVNGGDDVFANPPIKQAAYCNRVDAMNELYKLGANVNASAKSDPIEGVSALQNALETAVALGWDDSISWLLSHRADVCTDEVAASIQQLLSDKRIAARIQKSLIVKLECNEGHDKKSS